MKKLLGFVAIVFIATFAGAGSARPSPPSTVWGAGCCDIDPWTGDPRVRCFIPAAPVGLPCVCYGLLGSGFVCRL